MITGPAKTHALSPLEYSHATARQWADEDPNVFRLDHTCDGHVTLKVNLAIAHAAVRTGIALMLSGRGELIDILGVLLGQVQRFALLRPPASRRVHVRPARGQGQPNLHPLVIPLHDRTNPTTRKRHGTVPLQQRLQCCPDLQLPLESPENNSSYAVWPA